jgi:predicted nucleic acid-binding protein
VPESIALVDTDVFSGLYVDPVRAERRGLPVDATLTAACRRAGHALHDKVHTADRWVAAAAIAKRFPLLSGDAIYAAAPGLTLLR